MDGWTGVKAIREKTYMVISCTFEDRRFRVIRFTALSSIIPFFLFFFFFCRQGEKICSHEPWQGQACEEAWSGTRKRMPQSNLGCVVPQDWCGERDNDNASGCGNCTIFWVPSWKQRPRCTIPRRKRFTVAQKLLPERRREVFYQPPPARFIPHWHARDAPSRVGDGSRRKRAFNSVYVEKNKL